MDEHPDDPTREATQAQLPDAADRAETPDGRDAAEIAVLERQRILLTLQATQDGVGRVQTALHRDFGDAREVIERHHVANREHFGMPGKREVGKRRDATGPVHFRAGLLGEHRGER